MDPVQQLVEIEALRRLKARYWRCMDTKDYDGFAAVFTEDATLLFDGDVSTLGRDGKTNPIVRTRQGIKDLVSNSQRYATTVHLTRLRVVNTYKRVIHPEDVA